MGLIDNLFEGRNPRKTKDGLPKVIMETLNFFTEEINREVFMGRTVQEKVEQWTKELESENPTLLCYIYHAVSSYPPDLQEVSLARLIGLYQILKYQAIRDNLLSSKRIFDYYDQEGE